MPAKSLLQYPPSNYIYYSFTVPYHSTETRVEGCITPGLLGAFALVFGPALAMAMVTMVMVVAVSMVMVVVVAHGVVCMGILPCPVVVWQTNSKFLSLYTQTVPALQNCAI